MSIDWGAYLVVFAVALLAACSLVALFAFGIRLLASPVTGAHAAGTARDEELDEVPATRSPAATVGAVVVFALAGAGVLFGIWLMVPFLQRL